MNRLGRWLFHYLAEPATRGMSLDDPAMTARRRELAKTKRGLRMSYLSWYRQFQEIDRGAPTGVRVEIGSGGGFLGERIPSVVKTDVMFLPFLDVVCRAERLPFAGGSVGAIFMVNVFHHVSDVSAFLAEATRVLRVGGVVAMIEPFVTPFSRRLYSRFHPEPFDTEAPRWELPPSGPLSGGNDALPWIVFQRDRDRFRARHPALEIDLVRAHTAFTHLLSGGVMLRSLLPGPLHPAVHGIESRLGQRWLNRFGLFATIVVRRRA